MADRNLFQHYRPEELTFIESIDGLCGRVENEYRPILTPFLNPRELYILQTIANRYDGIKYRFDGGNENSEMKRALIYPDYYEPNQADFNIAVLQIDYPKKFASLSHGQILGSIMGSGIKRDVIGDIITDGDNWQLFCQSEMADYLKNQVDKIGKIKVKLKEIVPEAILISVSSVEEVATTVSSMRIDAIISTGFNVSRHHTKQLIDAGKVKLNWAVTQRSDVTVGIEDIISVRGFGRISIAQIAGVTRKDKIRLTLKLIKHDK